MRLQLIGAGVILLASSAAAAQEDSDWTIASDSLVYGDTDNVVVLSPQLTVRRALDDEGGEAGARVVVDVISAASVDVVSQASTRFNEVRTEADLSIAKAFGDYLPGLGYRYSHEPDYESHQARGSLRMRLGTPDSVLGLEYGLTADRVGRTGTPSSVFSESLTTHAATASLTQVLGRRTIVRATYSLTLQRGYMEKPYRFVPLFDAAGLAMAEADGVTLDLDSFDRYRLDARPPEEVPDSRQRHAVGLRALRFVDAINAALELDYQLYIDDWGVVAHVLEPSYRRIGESDVRLFGARLGRLGLGAYARLYRQSSAEFWERAYVVEDGQIPRLRTVDRELSSYLSATGGVRLEWRRDSISGYLDGSAMVTRYDDFLYLDDRLALVALGGFRWQL